MRYYDKITPDGTKDLLFGECDQRSQVTKTLKELLAEQGLAPPLRERLPLLAGEKTVEWVWGIGFRQGLAPNSNCRRAVYIETQWIGMEGEEDNA